MAPNAVATELAMVILILINEYMTTATNILLMIAQLMDIQQSIVAITKKRRKNSAAIACYLLGISPDKKPRVWIKPRSSQWWDESVPQFTNEEFISNFRVDRATFNYLVDMVKSDLTKEDTRFREAIPVTKKVGVALKMLGSNCNYGNLAGMFGVGRSTIHDCLKSFLVAANKHLVPKHIKWPDEVSVRKMAEEFEQIWQFPMVIGVLEAYHIPLSPPREIATNYLYYNAKETYSVIVLSICDAHGKFWWLKSGIPGRHDISTAFRESAFYKKACSGAAFPKDERPIIHTSVPYLVLGDSGFGLEPWLIEPYMCHETLSPSEIDFNCRVSSARGVADTAFARVKGRWRRLLRKLDLKMESVTATIDVCVALHNMCEDRKVPFDPKWLETSKEDTLLSRQPMYSSQGSSERAKQIRNALRDYFAGDCPTCTPQ